MHALRPLVIIEAPSALGLAKRGVEKLPTALLSAGLAERLRAQRGERLAAPPHNALPDRSTGLLNPDEIARFSVRLADAVGRALDQGAFPLVLGGDCSIVLGNLLALRRRGRYGLFFIDGHADFYQPQVLPDGEAASMDLALATGRGPRVVVNLEDRGPLVRDDDVLLFARRDAKEAEQYHSPRVEDTSVAMIDLAAVRAEGIRGAASRAVAYLEARPIEGYWVHVDVDVLDDAVMPAVDYRMPDGLHWDEFVHTLQAATGSASAVGLHVGIFNPELDEDGSIARALVNALAKGLGQRAS